MLANRGGKIGIFKKDYEKSKGNDVFAKLDGRITGTSGGDVEGAEGKWDEVKDFDKVDFAIQK